MNARRLRQWKLFLVATFAALVLLEMSFIIRQQRTQILAAAAQKTGLAMIDFAQTRARLLQRKPKEGFEQYEQRISAETNETQSRYAQLYSGEVARLRDSFARRGFHQPALDEFYKNPGSAIAIYATGRALFGMGMELRSEHFSAVLKGWLRRIFRPTTLSSSKWAGVDSSGLVHNNFYFSRHA